MYNVILHMTALYCSLLKLGLVILTELMNVQVDRVAPPSCGLRPSYTDLGGQMHTTVNQCHQVTVKQSDHIRPAKIP